MMNHSSHSDSSHQKKGTTRRISTTTTYHSSSPSWLVVLLTTIMLSSLSCHCTKRTTANQLLLASLVPAIAAVDAFAVKEARRSGGRKPSQPDRLDPQQQTWEAGALEDNECRLIICQITDVYTLENFASFKTMVQETKKNAPGATVLSMLTGDFLRPYLLSSVDRGKGMMNALNKIPLDILTWGNHEADIDHKTVCRHVRNFQGKWINSNMLDHDAMDHQQEYEVVELTSRDGQHQRKVGLCAVLSDDPKLYEQFSSPGAFGGATLTNPWEALTKYKNILEQEEGCDLVVPLQHLYVPDDHRTCREFDFPVVLSGHDHHRVDEVVDGTRLLKPGMNAVYSTVLEILWKSPTQTKPTIRARFVKNADWEPEPILEEECERSYDALAPLRNTELARVPPTFEPLSSAKARAEVCTMGKYICSLIRSSLNVPMRRRTHKADAAILMGGNIRGNVDEYPKGSFFSLESLESEIKDDEVIAVVKIPGHILAAGIEATHAGEPIPGWMQYDQGIRQDFSVSPPKVTHVAGQPLDPDRIYRVATKIGDLTNGQSPPLTEYFNNHPELLPVKGAYVNVQSELMSYFARNLWRRLWDASTERIEEECSVEECSPEGRLSLFDRDGDGVVTVEDIQVALHDFLGYSIDERELTVAELVYSIADTKGDGEVTLEDFEAFCDEIMQVYQNDEWRLSYKKGSSQPLSNRVPKEIFDQVVESVSDMENLPDWSQR